MTTLRRVLSASLLVGVLFGVDKVAGLLRQVIVARAYGVGAELDAYNAANNLPDALFALISGGALAIAFIPVLTEARERGGRLALWELFSRVANLAFVVTALAAGLIALSPLTLVQTVIAPGFAPEQQRLVADLMRLNLLATLVFSISGLVMGALQAEQHFLLPALAPLFYNLGQIAGVLVGQPRFGIYGLAWGTVAGALLHLAIQVPGLLRHGFRWTPQLTLREPGVQRVLRLMGPRVLTIACFNLIFIANDNLASRFEAGAVTALAYGWLIMQLPETVIGTAAGTALLPTLAELVARGDRAALRGLLRRAIGIVLALTVPIALVAWFALPLAVRLVFEGRAFTAEASALVVAAARLFMLGLAGHSVKELTARAFYAVQDARTPLITATINLGVFVGLGLALTPALGFTALALANSLSFTLEAGLMAALLARRKVL
jgi:putative peptidoglycan lipid II flippase